MNGHPFPSRKAQPLRAAFRLLQILILILAQVGGAFVGGTPAEAAVTRDTRTWTDPGGSGLQITFSTPETYYACASPGDRIYTSGVPSNWTLTGFVNVVVVEPGGTWVSVGYYPINQTGDLDLTLPYPPAWTWPFIPPPPNVRELHVDLGIQVRDQNGNVVPWVGGDPNLPGILGPGQDWDVFCQNPSPTPQISIKKYTNGADADDPNGGDVPNIAVGSPVVWTYRVTNPGTWLIHTSYITVSDDQPGVLPVFDHEELGNGDEVLDPGEVWVYIASGPALDLASPPAGVNVQQNACTHSGEEPERPAYINVGTVAIPGLSASDPSSYCNPPAFTLGDRVWYDQNQNGIQEANEPGYNGATVDLYPNAACTGMPMASTVTGAVGPAGFYQFTGLPAGPYCVQFGNIPAGWSISPSNQGVNDALDSDANTSARIPNINLTADDPDEDMGIYVPGSLGDMVVCLTTGAPLANITVSLFEDFNGDGVADGPAIKTTFTNAAGFYQFTGLQVALAGDPFNLTKYLVVVDVNDADLGQCNVPVPPTSYNPPLDSNNPNDPNNDFWFEFPPPAFTLGDRVWYDQNQNGIQEANEPGYNGATVDLYPNAACTGMPMASTVTGAVGPAGFYQFTGLPAGPYCVQFGNIPAGWSISPSNQGVNDALDSDANTSARIPNINLTADDPDEDMGIYVPGSLGDMVVCLTTGAPLANITVSLFEDFNGDGVADGPAIKTTFTNAAGFYQFTGLQVALAGDPLNLTKYLVVVDVNDADLGQCNVPVPPTSYNPPLDSNNPNDPNNDFQFEFPPCQITLGDRVWYDANLNGLQDMGEVGLDGIVLNLLDANGSPVLDGSGNAIQAITANGGFYQFVVPCGSYQIAVVLPDGKTLTLVQVGNNRAVDSNPNPSPAPTIPLPNGGQDISIDFGLVNFEDLCPPDGTTGLPTPVGTLYWGVDANGDVYVRYDQSRGLNDNSYGTTRVLWPRDHKFGDLVGSDKAQLIFKDAAGKVVLDINLDYISAKSGTPSGYASLGVTGGEGKTNIGSAAWVLAADTSLAKSLNTTGFCVGGNCSAGGTNLLVNSPPTVSASSYDLPAGSPYVGWNFTNSYEVKISRLAFGSSSFGSVAVGEAHNSPPKVGSNAVAPVVCQPVGVCSIVGGLVQIKDRNFKWPVTNNGSSAAILTNLNLVWPQGNGQLRKVKFDGDVVWSGNINWTAAGSTLTSADFTTDLKKKRIDPGKTRTLTLEFEKNAGTDLTAYTLQLTFDNSCVVQFVPPTYGANFCATAPGSGRAKTLTMVYTDANGGDNTSFNCTSNCNTQDASKVIVTGDPAPDTSVWILAVPTGKTNVLFQGLVDLFQSFVMSAANAGLSTFDTNTTLYIYSDGTKTSLLSTVQFHTSCSQPLNDGDYYGSLMLTGFTR